MERGTAWRCLAWRVEARNKESKGNQSVKNEKIKIEVCFVDEKDVPPETLARMEMNAQAFKRTAGRMMHEEWNRRWFSGTEEWRESVRAENRRNGIPPLHATI
jgi:hypothetical protein